MRHALLPMLSLVLGACGDPLVGGLYRGEPLFSLSGTVIADSSPEDYGWPDGKLRISLEWAEYDGADDDDVYNVEELQTLTDFPSQFLVHIYHPPPLDALFTAPWMPGELVSVGRPLLYVDADADGRLDRDTEPVVGGAFDIVLVYVEPPWNDELQPEYGEPVDPRWEDDIWEDEPFADRGLELNYGFQRMFDRVELCEWADEMEEGPDGDGSGWSPEDWFPREDQTTYLFIGDVETEGYFDWECDGED